MKNPNLPIRRAFVQTIKNKTGLNVWGKRVPKSTKPIPEKYVLIGTQTKQRFAVGKQCWEWICQIVVDINYVNAQGFSNTERLDEMEEQVINAIDGIQVDGFNVKFNRLLSQTQLDADTPTQSIERTILMYELWLNKAI